MPQKITMRLPYKVVDYLRAHPEVKASALMDRLCREHYGLPAKRKQHTNLFSVTVQDDVIEALHQDRKYPLGFLRALITREIARRTS